MQRHTSLKCTLLALTLCFTTPQVVAQTGEKILSGVSTAHDTAVDVLKSVKRFKPSDFKMALGNTAARKVWANWANAKVSSALEISKSAHLPAISTALEAAGSGAELLANVYEGDAVGAGTVILSTAVSKVTVAGGAMAGGKLFAYVGAVAGAWVPVVGPVAGGVVGGVVGSVGGAVVSSVAIGSDTAKDWFNNTIDGYFARDKTWYTQQARQTREGFLADQAQQAAIVKGEQEKAKAARDFGYDMAAGSSDNSEIQFAGKLPEFDLPAKPQNDPGKTIPLFPSSFTVEITSWVNPDFSAKEVFIITEGQVSAYINAPVPTLGYANSGRREGAFKGSIEGNKITGTWTDRFMYNGLSNKCNTLYNNAQNTIEHILNQDGTITGKITGGTHKIRTSGCPGGDINRTDQVPPTALQGRWKLRD